MQDDGDGLNLLFGADNATEPTLRKARREASVILKEPNVKEMTRVKAAKAQNMEPYRNIREPSRVIDGPDIAPVCRTTRLLLFTNSAKAKEYAAEMRKRRGVVYVRVWFRGNIQWPYLVEWGRDPVPVTPLREEPKFTRTSNVFVIGTHNPAVYRSIRWHETAEYRSIERARDMWAKVKADYRWGKFYRRDGRYYVIYGN